MNGTRRTPNLRLKALLDAARMSQAQLAYELRSLGGEQGLSLSCDHTAVRRWLAGAQPRPPIPALLLECFSRRLGRPVSARDAGLTHTPIAVLDPAWEADPVRRLVQLTGAEIDHAQLLEGASSFSLAALYVPDEIGPSRAMCEAASARSRTMPQRVPPIANRWHGMSHLFYTGAETYGGQSIRSALSMFVADRVIPVLYFPSHGQDRRSLLSAAARLVLLLGNMTADSGRSGRAQQFHRVAARFAADAGDSVTLAIALRTMAAHAYELGHRSPAVLRLSEQAVVHANNAPPAVQAYAQAHYAVLLAHYDRQAAMEALTRAEHLHGRADAPIGPFTAYPISAMYYQRAQALSVLGDHSASVNALTTSLRLRAATEYRAACLTRACLAEAYLRSGHLEKALTHWQAFLTTYPTLSSTRATRYLSTMSMRLRPYQRHRIARQLLDQAYLLR